MRHRAVAAALVGALLLAVPSRASATEVVISINKANQTMSVLVDGMERYNWAVSTGLGGGPHDGNYRPGRMERKWASRKYNMAPMPHSIFFDGNYAIHGTIHIKRLGHRASKGCVRLHPENAAILFDLVGREKTSTSIVVSKDSHVAATAVAKPELATLDSAKPALEPVKADSAVAAQPPTAAVAAAPEPPRKPRARAKRKPAATPAVVTRVWNEIGAVE